MSDTKSERREPKKTHRLTHGQGSFYYREKDGRWVGAFVSGVLPNGKPKRTVVTHKKEDAAWAKLKEAREEYLRDGPTPDGVKRNQTVAGWGKAWLEKRAGTVRWKTEQVDRTNVTKWIIPAIGRSRLSTLNASHMDLVGDYMLKAEKSLSTINSAQRTLNKMLVDAVANGYRIPQAIFAAKKMPLGKGKRGAMTKDQVRATFQAASDLYSDVLKFFITVLYGARISEVLALTLTSAVIDDSISPDGIVAGRIDLSRQVQQLPKNDAGKFKVKRGEEAELIVDSWHFTYTKTEAGERVLPLSLPVSQAITAWEKACVEKGVVNPHGLLFPRITGKKKYLGYPQQRRVVLEEWQAAQAAAGVYKVAPTNGASPEYFLMHEARHSMISILMDAGVPKHIIEALVGQTKLVKNYVHPSLTLAGEEINRVLAPLLPALEG